MHIILKNFDNCTSYLLTCYEMILDTSCVLYCLTFGYPSTRIWIVSLAMVSVVKNTITENNIVQSGSAHLYVGSNLIMMDDINTPTD